MNSLKNNCHVAVTGLGLVTPLGIGVDDSWNNLLSGVSACKFDPILKTLF
ncbi:hypothetical protein GQ597_02235 [Gilliamella sp. Pra-s65]|nr:hypothetical protein [Gilliamella sp. Pra-s65]MWP72542.1 hypothetical protein [Gilliamella sp. Pra-s52]